MKSKFQSQESKKSKHANEENKKKNTLKQTQLPKDAGQKFVTFFCFQKSANFRLFCIISLVEPLYFQGRLIMG